MVSLEVGVSYVVLDRETDHSNEFQHNPHEQVQIDLNKPNFCCLLPTCSRTKYTIGKIPRQHLQTMQSLLPNVVDTMIPSTGLSEVGRLMSCSWAAVVLVFDPFWAVSLELRSRRLI